MIGLDRVVPLLEAGLAQDAERVRKYGEELATSLEASSKAAAARKVREALRRKREHATMVRLESSAEGLLAQSLPGRGLDSLVLPTALLASLRQVLREHQEAATLSAAGLTPTRRLLLVGPPGTGKTSTAAALAAELRLPLLVVRLSALVSSFRGETGKHLARVCDTLRRAQAVVLLDEVDAVGRARTGAEDGASREQSGALSTFLQELDSAEDSPGLLVAATNLPQALDGALVRRFEVRLEYCLPDAAQLAAALKERLKLVPGAERVDWKEVGHAGAVAGLNHASALAVAVAEAKAAVLAGEHLTTGALAARLLGAA